MSSDRSFHANACAPERDAVAYACPWPNAVQIAYHNLRLFFGPLLQVRAPVGSNAMARAAETRRKISLFFPNA